MTNRFRLIAVVKLRKMLDSGTPRKVALMRIISDVRDKGFKCSRSTIYIWCRRFKVSTQ